MIQQLLIAALFLAALYYIGRIAWRSWRTKDTCEAGCSKCNVAEIDAMVKNIQKAGNDSNPVA